MKKTYLLAIIPIVFLLAASFLWAARPKKPDYSTAGNIVRKIQIDGNNFLAEVVNTPEKRALGLSGRPELCPECAMLFTFEKSGEYSFWMKDMRFDLDIVWIAGNEIIGIAKNVSHMRGSAEVVHMSAPIDKVLEINAGVSDRLNLKAGDKVEFSKAD